MKIKRKTWMVFASIVAMILVAVCAVPEEESSSDAGLFHVARVVDGDTIKLENGETVRYIGIDTPETVDPRRPVGCFGKEAGNKNTELVLGKEIRLEKDISDADKYGRLLRYVYVGDIFVNEYLVREGYARASSYPPDVKYQELFREAEWEAREMKRGLWADETCAGGK
jgi:micrococcal nuclease